LWMEAMVICLCGNEPSQRAQAVIASEAKQSIGSGAGTGLLRRCAPRNDVVGAER
jgi:hypothetical protein